MASETEVRRAKYDRLIAGLLDAAAEALLPDGLKDACNAIVEFASNEPTTNVDLDALEAKVRELMGAVDSTKVTEIEPRFTKACP